MVLVVVKFAMLFNFGVAVSIKFGGVQGRGEVKFKSGTIANGAIIALGKGGVESAKRRCSAEFTASGGMQDTSNLLTVF